MANEKNGRNGPPIKKRCRKCGLRKLVKTQFYLCKANPDGVRSYCKPCGKAMSEGYRKAKNGKKGGKRATKTPKRKPVRKPQAARAAS